MLTVSADMSYYLAVAGKEAQQHFTGEETFRISVKPGDILFFTSWYSMEANISITNIEVAPARIAADKAFVVELEEDDTINAEGQDWAYSRIVELGATINGEYNVKVTNIMVNNAPADSSVVVNIWRPEMFAGFGRLLDWEFYPDGTSTATDIVSASEGAKWNVTVLNVPANAYVTFNIILESYTGEDIGGGNDEPIAPVVVTTNLDTTAIAYNFATNNLNRFKVVAPAGKYTIALNGVTFGQLLGSVDVYINDEYIGYYNANTVYELNNGDIIELYVETMEDGVYNTSIALVAEKVQENVPGGICPCPNCSGGAVKPEFVPNEFTFDVEVVYDPSIYMAAGYYTFEASVKGVYYLTMSDDVSCDQGNYVVYDGTPIELTFGGMSDIHTITATLINVENKISTTEAWIEADANYAIDLEEGTYKLIFNGYPVVSVDGTPIDASSDDYVNFYIIIDYVEGMVITVANDYGTYYKVVAESYVAPIKVVSGDSINAGSYFFDAEKYTPFYLYFTEAGTYTLTFENNYWTNYFVYEDGEERPSSNTNTGSYTCTITVEITDITSDYVVVEMDDTVSSNFYKNTITVVKN
jgi:hypothetical protein